MNGAGLAEDEFPHDFDRKNGADGEIARAAAPPAPSRPVHSSAPSMAFSTEPRKDAHNRDVTPHTESLMNLFARPPVCRTPVTPVTPMTTNSGYGYGAVYGRNGGNGGGGLPLLPDDYHRNLHVQQQDAKTPRRTNSCEKTNTRRTGTEDTDEEDVASADVASADVASADVASAIRIPLAHNFYGDAANGETLTAHNLTKKDDLREDQIGQLLGGVLAGADEITHLLSTQQHASKIDQGAEEGGRPRFAGILRLLPSSASSAACDPERLMPALVAPVLYFLYQLVFCFAEASAIRRPSTPPSASSALLAPMALMACMGSLLSAPMLIAVLGGEHRALYPCLDMFMAPFLARMAGDIDEVLVALRDEGSPHDDDARAFLATFVALNAFGTLLSGLLCVSAGKVKLANLAGFLPYPVLCGFFSSVGIGLWASAFKVDTGLEIRGAFASGGGPSPASAFARHAPSLVAGAALHALGPRGPHYLVGVIVATIASAYLVMALTGTTHAEAQHMCFFWRDEEVMMPPSSGEDGGFRYGPPAAFGLWSPAVLGEICWPAFRNGLPNAVAMSVIYLLRCSLHAAALNKITASRKRDDAAESHPPPSENGERTMRCARRDGGTDDAAHEPERGRRTREPERKPRDLMLWYANSLFAVALSGGFAVLPAFSIGGIFYKIGADGRGPQYAAMILLLGCYLSNFWICSYIPKCAFSSLLVLAAIDLVDSWFVRSYRKSAASEWVVVPLIVVASLTNGMLQSVGLGLGVSTLIFVASFYRAGVVKFIANGLTIRSTIERNFEDNQWLYENADLIQLLVLQNYLFFGNASSCLNYIRSMFDDEAGFDPDLPPIPKYVILDLSIVTGIDTSAVDVVDEISSLCRENECNLILAGVPRIIRPALIAGGVRPSRKNKHLSYALDLDCALGRAEDGLLKFVGHNEEKAADVGAQLMLERSNSMVDHGLRHALREIDAQHAITLGKHLQSLEKYTTPIEINAGDKLNDPGQENNLVRGLYFVEAGLLRCEHDSLLSPTRGATRSGFFAAPHISSSTGSIGRVNARSATVGRTANLIKKNPQGAMVLAQDHVFRLARVGPGWIIGSISEFIGQDIPGTYTALTPCRVHHLTFETIEELEIDRPVLILHLYKLLSHLSARRQEMTIGQLATMRSIFSSTAPTKPISRSKMAKLCTYKSN